MRLSGCPFNIRDYSVSIRHPLTGEFVRVKGVNSMRIQLESETDDSRSGDALWAETFIKERSASGTIEGKPIQKRLTGETDPGQALMRRAAWSDGGCENDQTLLIADAVGNAVQYDCVITGEERGADEDGETITWTWAGVGRPTEIPYVQAAGIALVKDGGEIESLALTQGDTDTIRAVVRPAAASNRRYSYWVKEESVARVLQADGEELTLQGISQGSTELVVRTINNRLTASLTIVVGAAA